MQASCLCGTVQFELKVAQLNIYQCHCRLCRKQTGTAASAGAIVPLQQLSWLAGAERVSVWVKDSGFTSAFCSGCGSSVPNRFRNQDYYWVPAGLVDSEQIEVVVQLFVDDKAAWSAPIHCGLVYPTRPSLQELMELLMPTEVGNNLDSPSL